MYNPQKTEKDILEFWEKNEIFKKLRKKLSKSKKVFSFIDGPITANNPMGVHHAWGRTYKDLYQRFKAMQGFNQRWQNGFDCQGLHVEVGVEKNLGFNSKKDIEKFGMANFSKECRKSVEHFAKVQTKQSIRLGQWMDWENSYYTMSDTNIEYIWYFLKKCHEKGWLYKGTKVLPWCIRCGTSSSQHEMSDEGYKELTHLGIFIKCPVIERKNEFLLIWTTTAWTLTANVAAAVHPKLNYVKVKKGDEIYYLSEGTVKNFSDFVVLDKFKGEKLIGLNYESPYKDLPAQNNIKHKVVGWELVNEKEGTGIIHIAPGCGIEDNELGKKYGLTEISPLDEGGNYIKGFGWFTNKNVKDVAPLIIEDLKKRGFLFKVEDYTHRYPICWRCKEELIFRIGSEWFISCDEIRPLMKKEAKKVKWEPKHIGKLMQDWLTNMEDWNISRKRFWGLPLMFFECDCGHLIVIGSLKELKERAIEPEKVDALPELHRPWIDDIKIKCDKCGHIVKRIKEVGDCWLDAGIVPFSTIRYFDDKEYWKTWFPADLIIEMRAQVRLWFYSLLFMAITLEGKSPYKSVVSYEEVRDRIGRPMHKSLGNAIWFDEAVEKIGADVMRYMYLTQNPNFNLLFSFEKGEEIKKILIIFFNTIKYLETYLEANQKEVKIDNFNTEKNDVLECKWLLSRLESTKKNVTNYLEQLKPHLAIKEEQDFFLNDLSRWYGQIIRNDIKPLTKSKNKQIYLNIFYKVTLDILKLLAPFIPFVTESLYQDFFGKNEKIESIHLHNWPKIEKNLINKKLENQMKIVQSVVEASNALRQENNIKLKYPLLSLTVSGNRHVLESVKNLNSIIRKMANVKQVKISKFKPDYTVKPNYAVLGKKFKKDVKKIVEELKKEDVNRLKNRIEKKGEVKVAQFVLEKEDLIFSEKAVTGREFDSGRIILDLKITDELKKEWLLRELVRAVQEKRKEIGLKIADKIKLFLPDEFKRFEDTIKKETGSEIIFGEIKGERFGFVFENKNYEFGIEK